MYIATTFRSWNIKINNMALAKTILCHTSKKIFMQEYNKILNYTDLVKIFWLKPLLLFTIQPTT